MGGRAEWIAIGVCIGAASIPSVRQQFTGLGQQ